MTTGALGSAQGRRHLRAPRTSGAIVIEPPLEQALALWDANLALRQRYDYDVQGRRLVDLAASARAELLREAQRYTRTYRDVRREGSPQRILLAGHQPQLFHPGVWLKNFALSALAARADGVAVNLVIDNDTVKRAAARVPGGTVADPTMEDVPYDEPSAVIPYEERPVMDRDCLASFGRRAAARIEPLVARPLVHKLWPLVIGRAEAGESLAGCLSQSRHRLEDEWGLSTLELPQGRVCQFEAFYWFACHVLAHLGRFREYYNAAVAAYRRENRIRSANHPVPDLTADGEWLEAPFWIWHRNSPRRRRLFAKLSGDSTVLSDRAGLEIRLPLTAERDGGAAVAVLAELAGRGIKIRTRALSTTLFARLFLADVFLHGIGGAKYDELTNELVRRFFELEPPGFLVVAGTLHLNIPRQSVTDEQLRQVDQRLRDLAFHPERFIEPERISPPSARGGVQALMATKQRWIATTPTRANAKLRCQGIQHANAALAPWLADERHELESSRTRLATALRAEAVLAWREYAFCLHAEESLRNFLLEFSRPKP